MCSARYIFDRRRSIAPEVEIMTDKEILCVICSSIPAAASQPGNTAGGLPATIALSPFTYISFIPSIPS
jgi:hypothetical protein